LKKTLALVLLTLIGCVAFGPTPRTPHKRKVPKNFINQLQQSTRSWPEDDTLQEQLSYVGRIESTFTKKGRKISTGTGSCYPIRTFESEKGFIVFFLTANHVITGQQNTIFLYKHPERYISQKATIVLKSVVLLDTSVALDAALLMVKTDTYVRPMKLNSHPPRFLQRVLAVGCPIGHPPFVTEGLISRTSGNHREGPRWALSAPIAPGNSGGPVVDAKTGEVVGTSVSIWGYGGEYGDAQLVLHYHNMVPMSAIKPWAEANINKLRKTL
jgi:S1-C subfamily serine protease